MNNVYNEDMQLQTNPIGTYRPFQRYPEVFRSATKHSNKTSSISESARDIFLGCGV